MGRWRLTAGQMAGLGAVIGLYCAIWRMTQPGLTDFQTFWFIAHGHIPQAYDPYLMVRPEAVAWAHPKAPLPFPYPPPALLLFGPTALLPWQAAYALWSSLQLGLFAYLSHKRAGQSSLLLLFSAPAIYSAILGQTGLLMTDAVLAAFWLLPTRPAIAGAILAAAGCIKPQSVIAAPLALRRSPRALVFGAVTATVILVASLALGPARWTEWLAALPVFPKLIIQWTPIAPSALFQSNAWKAALAIIGLGFAVWEGGFVGFVVGTVLASPYVQLYDLGVVSVLGCGYVSRWWSSRSIAGLPMAVAGLSITICPGPAWILLLFFAAVIGLTVRERLAQVRPALAQEAA